MGLSPDPEKRRAQLANLRRGWEHNAKQLREPDTPADPAGAQPPAAGAHAAPEPAPSGALEVLPYADDETHEPAPEPAAGRRAEPEHDEPPEPEAEPEHGRGGGPLSELWRGFFG